jgi:hypothetical protein
MPKRTLDDAFPSKYLTAADVEGKTFSATIERVEYEKMRDSTEKPVAYFEGLKKAVVLNKTKAKFLAELTKSKKFDDWIGVKIQIREGTANYAGDDVPSIRFERTAAKKKADVKKALNGDDLPDSMKAGDDEDDEDDLS